MKAKLDWQTFTTNAIATFLGVELSVKYNGNGKFEATVYVKGRRPEKDHTFSTLKDGMEWCEQTLQRWIDASFEKNLDSVESPPQDMDLSQVAEYSTNQNV